MISIWISSSAQATNVAMVLDVKGETLPQVQICSQFPKGSQIKLKANASITFNHYRKCEEITVSGAGKLLLTERAYAFSGTDIEVKPFICQDTLDYVDPDMEPAGLATRSVPKPIRFTTTAQPLIVTPHYVSGENTKIAITLNDSPDIFMIPITGSQTKWPSDEFTLVPGQKYQVTVIHGGVRSKKHAEITVVSADNAALTNRFLVLNFKRTAVP